MNKCLSALLALTLFAGGLASCDDKLSLIGESIQPKRDVVESEKYFLQFQAQTVEASTLYSGISPTVLLGAYSDPTYGGFVADFAAQFRTGLNLTFEHKPEGGRIDSVVLDLIFKGASGLIGSKTAPVQFAVYELPGDFVGSDTSSDDLSQYAQQSRLLGEQVLRLDKDLRLEPPRSEEERQDPVAYLRLHLNRALGQRIYDKTLSAPQDFATQERFAQEVFAGLYVTPSTGRGFVVKPLALSLKVYYHYKDQEGKNQTAYTAFINTKLTARRNGLSSQDLSTLLAPNDKYSYSKGPAGVQTAISLGKDQLERLLQKRGAVSIGKDWALADAQLNLQVDNPEGVLLNPPAYMMLMPVDSLALYFKEGHTERSASASSYLSTRYTSATKNYNFFNVSPLLTKHLQAHARFVNGAWQVDKDLLLRVVPVERSVSSDASGNEQTTAIDEYLFPNFVRLKTDAAALRIGVTASIFK